MIHYVNQVLASRKRESRGVKVEGNRAKVYSLEINNNGVTASLAEHCRMAGVAYSTARARLGRGMPLEDVLKPEKYYRKVEAFGVMDTLIGHCARHGLKYSTVYNRLKTQGKTLEQALTDSSGDN